LVHAEKCRTEDKLQIQAIHKLNKTKKNQRTEHKNSETKLYPGLVASYDTKRGGLILQRSRARTGHSSEWMPAVNNVPYTHIHTP